MFTGRLSGLEMLILSVSKKSPANKVRLIDLSQLLLHIDKVTIEGSRIAEK